MSDLKTFHQEFRRAIAEVLSAIGANSWKTESSAPPDVAPEVHAVFQMAGDRAGRFALSFTTSDAHRLASLLLGTDSASTRTELTPDESEAVAEAARQIAGNAAEGLRQFAPDLKIQYVGSTLESTYDLPYALLARCGEQEIRIGIAADFDLSRSFQRVHTEAPTPEPRNPGDALRTPAIPSDNLSLLMDVALTVSVRFGRKDVLLKDVLELRTGSVLELDREVSEPVDLILNGRVIARGDVVIVGGNYGIRVTEVAGANERAQSIA